MIKNIARRILKRDGRQYSIGELIRVALGGSVFDPERFTPHPTMNFFELHRGFDHRLLRAEVAGRLKVVGQYKTPLNRLPLVFNQEVVLLATKL